MCSLHANMLPNSEPNKQRMFTYFSCELFSLTRCSWTNNRIFHTKNSRRSKYPSQLKVNESSNANYYNERGKKIERKNGRKLLKCFQPSRYVRRPRAVHQNSTYSEIALKKIIFSPGNQNVTSFDVSFGWRYILSLLNVCVCFYCKLMSHFVSWARVASDTHFERVKDAILNV